MPASSKLDTLALSFNQLKSVQGLSRCQSLTVLDLHNNKLTQVPEEVYNLYSLKTLTISNNDINNLDARLALLPDLLRLNIEGNPLRSIKPAMRSANAV